MTALFASTYSEDKKTSVMFFTADDYPHVSDKSDDVPFHILRVGEKRIYTPEMMMAILAALLADCPECKTTAPQVTDRDFNVICCSGIEAALIDFGDEIVVSTIVHPIDKD